MQIRRCTFYGVLGSVFCVMFASTMFASTMFAADDGKVKVLIGFKAKPGIADLDAVKGVGGKITRRFKIIPSVAATIPAKAVARLIANPRVSVVEPDVEVSAHDIEQTWGVKRIGCGPVHDGSFMTNGSPVLGSGVNVAVLDTGIDYTHSQLAPIYKGGYDFINGDNDPFDDHYHGTHCAGTVAAARDSAGVVGVAPNVNLFGLKVLGSNGSGSFSAIIAAMDWCVVNNIQVASLSLGSQGDPGSQVRAAFDNAYAQGVVIVASAGNAGSGSDTVGWPAQYDSVIAVASTTNSDSRSSFSSTGPNVELAAPGSSILSTYPGERYAYLSGTSMACPHVAGLAALLISAGIADLNEDGNINDEVRTLMQQTAEDLGSSGRDQEFGFGLVNAELSVLAVLNGSGGGGGGGGDPPPIFNAPTNLFGTVSGTTVTLSWEDNSNVEDGFQVWQGIKVKKNTTWELKQTTGPNANVVEIAGLSDGKYRYRVRAIKSDGETTPFSNEIELSIGKSGGGGGGRGRR